jgi:hypothetical protein
MEFFDWTSVPQIVLMYLTPNVESGAQAAAQMRWIQMICLICAAGLYLAGLLCGGFGLMTMAKRQGIKFWWIGFLPFGNTYLTGKLAGETNFFGKKMKRMGLYAMICEIMYVVFQIAMLVAWYQLMSGEFFVLVEPEKGPSYWEFDPNLVGQMYPQHAWIVTFYNVISVIAQAWWFVMLLFFCFLFSAFFRKYYARSPFLMTFLCAFLPLRGFVLLAVRKNTPVDYNAYLHRRYEQMRQQQGGYGAGGYGTPNAPSGGNEPFSDFGSPTPPDGGSNGGNSDAGGSPFEDFK